MTFNLTQPADLHRVVTVADRGRYVTVSPLIWLSAKLLKQV